MTDLSPGVSCLSWGWTQQEPARGWLPTRLSCGPPPVLQVLTFSHGGVCKADVGLYPGHRSGSLNLEEGDLENLDKHSLGGAKREVWELWGKGAVFLALRS